MQDQLESYIIKHKAQLDVFEPDDRLWERIDREINSAKGKRMPLWTSRWTVAASIILLVGLGGLLWLNRPIDRGGLQIDPKSLYSSELVEVEAYYTQMISDQKAQIDSYREQGVVIDETLLQQNEQLTSAYLELQQELLRTEDQGLIVNAMIQNLMMQMEILNQQLRILEQIKQLRNGNQINL